jgi:hypothetical protein
MYEEGTSVGLIKETFPDIKINNNLYMFLPYATTFRYKKCYTLIFSELNFKKYKLHTNDVTFKSRYVVIFRTF